MIGKTLHRLNPRVGMRLVPLESEGDRIHNHPLAQVGGKGLFTRAIEAAVLDGRADIAIHSFKDLPTEPTPGLIIAATPRRFPAHDVLVSAEGAKSIRDLPKGATLGTCSPRRAAQALRIRNDLKIVTLRGNVDTRIRKCVEDHEIDAVLLAAAGLTRLGLTQHTVNPVPLDEVLPAAGQGGLAIQCRVDDHVTLRRCLPLNDSMTSTAINAERQVVAALSADCHSPVAIYAETVGLDQLRIRARVLSLDGLRMAEADQTGSVKKLRALCDEVTDTLLKQGARKLLDEATQQGVMITE
jgi:hydroxymethylbilane synthase